MTTMQRTQDSTLAYYINQLDNFDPVLHEPLVAVTWSRDIKLRTGISLANESTSFTRAAFAGAGGQTSGSTIPWISGNTNALQGVDVNGERIVTPLRPAAREIVYSSLELDRSQLTGQPIDLQKMNAFNLMYQMSIDQMVYIGDDSVGATGLVNTAGIDSADATNGSWDSATVAHILQDVNDCLNDAWEASGFAVCPDTLLLPPAKFALLASQIVSSAGNMSILQYLKQNTISLQVNGVALDIKPAKFLGRQFSSKYRMVAYTNDATRLRFPLVPVRRDNAYYLGINFHSPYLWAMGEVEFIYPETVIYRNNI